MKSSSHLHQLIRTLTREEKAAFAKALKSGKKGGNSLYLRLFLTVADQETYDEPAIRNAFENTSFGKSLGFPKSHLYDRLLDHLHMLQLGVTTASRLRTELDKVELLAEKGLPEQAMRLIEKGLKQAMELEDAVAVLQLLRLKRRQVMRLQAQELAAEVAKISTLEMRWEAAFHMEQMATRLHDELYSLFQEVRRKARAADDPHLQSLWMQLEQLLATPSIGFPATVAVLRARAHYHHMREDFGAVHDAYQAEIKAWEAHPLQIQAAPLRYVRLIGQWLTSKALIGDNDGLLAEIKRLRNRAGLDSRGEAEVFQTSYTLELYYYLNADRAREALPLLDAVTAGLSRHDQQLTPGVKLGFYYNLALVHWLSAQPSAALKWVHRILQFEKGAIRKDIRDFAHLLEKVFHYELGNTGVLESWFRAARYRQRKQSAAPTLEIILVELIQKLLGSVDPSHHALAFQTFDAALEALAEQPGVSKLGIQELRAWGQKLGGERSR